MARNLAVLLLAGVSGIAFGSVASAQDAPRQETQASTTTPAGDQNAAADTASEADVVVTGSRIVSNGNNAPTPVTVISTDELRLAAPTNLADGLNKLPILSGSRTQQTVNNASGNGTGNFLNLRGFGIIRSLILLDGHRVPASSAEGWVDTNTLPQAFVKRVDIVTGGASAVYGSDAVTGVVNFVLDRNFNGLRGELNGSISSRGDAQGFRALLAGGHAFLDDRLHLEGSYEHYQQAGIKSKLARPTGAAVYCRTGAGTAANPYVQTPNCRNSTSSFGGLILSGPAAGQEFASNGVLSPFVRGAPTGSNGAERGGNGTYIAGSALTASIETDQVFGRADYEFDDGIRAYVQGAWNRAFNSNDFVYSFFPGFNTFSTSNGYLSTAARAAVSAGGAQTFNFSRMYADAPAQGQSGLTKNFTVTAGFEGKFLDRFDWNFFYTFGRTTLHEVNRNNPNAQRLAAALDAVVNPANGQVVCNVTLTNPGLYPGCVPINPFGPTATGATGLDYVRQDTYFDEKNSLHDFGASVTGDLFDLPAGPVKAAVSAEYRRVFLSFDTPFLPTQLANCTGLRFNCTPTTALWQSDTVGVVRARQGIAEVGGELAVPIVQDGFLGRSLGVTGAYRYANYTASGSAHGWKLGAEWRPIDGLTFRGTRSRDFRAPTLFDLFAPLRAGPVAFFDIVSNSSGFPSLVTRGNPDLKPEIAMTWTGGVVFQPQFLRGFSVSVDYYNIKIDDGIFSVGGNSQTFNQQCRDSGGTSPLCALYIRPTPTSFPTTLLSTSLNVATARTKGVDIETNYNFAIDTVGAFNLRVLASYQPTLGAQSLPGQPFLNASGTANGVSVGTGAIPALFAPKWRFTALAGFKTGGFAVNVQTRWRQSLERDIVPALVYQDERIASFTVTDLTVSYDLPIRNNAVSLFATVQNLFDAIPPVYTNSGAGFANFGSPTVQGDSMIGQYFTVGTRFKF